MLSTDIDNLNTEYEGYNFKPVIASGKSFNVYKYEKVYPAPDTNPSYYYENWNSLDIDWESSLKTNPIRAMNNISGIMSADTASFSYYNLKLLDGGRMPQKQTIVEGMEGYDRYTHATEILISKNLAKGMVENCEDITEINDILTNEYIITIYLGNNTKYFKVVGIVEDDTDISMYENLNQTGEESGSIMQMMYDSELSTVLNYGLVNMCYVTPEDFIELNKSYYNTNLNYTYRYNETSSTNFSYNSFYDINDYIEYKNNPNGGYYPFSDITFKDGHSALTMTDNDVVIGVYDSIHSFQAYGCVSYEELLEKINSGLTLELRKSWNGDVVKTLNIIGYTNNYSFLKQSTMNELFGGYDYAISRFQGTNADRSIIKSIYNSKNENNLGFGIKFKSSPIFENFGGLIEDLTTPFLYVGLGLAVFAGFMLMNFISTSISYKQREIGVLRAIGARGKDVFSIFFSESFVICVINFILATIGCGIAAYFINQSVLVDLGINVALLSFGIRQIILMFGVSLLVAIISTFFPVYRIAKKNPIDSINNR